jgi:prepilin-type N-terminal cleavage/methylation domain-containing protein
MNLSLRKIRAGFTLTELLVVIIIVSLLSALTLGALRSGGIRAKEDSARSFVVHLSESLLEFYEELDDQGSTTEVVNGFYKIRWQIPVSRSDAIMLSGGIPISPFGSTYSAYLSRIPADSAEQSAECLYMIFTQTGSFVDFLETLHETQAADTDGDGADNVFIDTWGTPIRMEFSPAPPPGEDINNNNRLDIEDRDRDGQLDPGEDTNGNNILDTEDINGNGVLDHAVITTQNLPIIRSAGVDLEFNTADDIVSIDGNGIILQ